MAVALAAVAGCASPKGGGWRGYDPFPADSYVMEAPPAGDGVLGVRAAVEQALEHNAELALLRQAAEVARAESRTWPELRDPEIGFGYGEGLRETTREWLVPRSELAGPDGSVVVSGADEMDDLQYSSNTYHGTTVDSDSYRVSVRFYPPNPFLGWARHAANKANYAAALSDLRAAEWTTAMQVRRLFAEMAFLRAELALLERLGEARQALSSAADDLGASRQVPLVDVLAASQRYVQTLADQDKARSDLAAAQAELAVLMGRSAPAEALDLPGAEAAGPCATNVQAALLKQQAIRDRYDVTAAYWRWQAAAAALREVRSARIPWFSRLEASYAHTEWRERPEEAWDLDGGDAVLDWDYSVSVDTEEEDEWRIEALVTVPFFSLGPRVHRIQLADHRHARAVMDETARSALAQVDESLAQLRAAEERRARLEADIGPRLAQVRAALEEIEPARDLPPQDAAKAREALVEMELALLRVGRDHRLAALALEEAAGAEIPAP